MLYNFPTWNRTFHGRERDVDDLHQRLTTTHQRLISIIGMGGIGKTRLATQVGKQVESFFPDGVYFIPLQPVDSSDQLVFTIAERLGILLHGQSSPRDALLKYLNTRQILLIVDNFEHLMDGKDLLTDLVARTQNLRLLITTREALSISAEWRYPLRGLSYPYDRGQSSTSLNGFSALTFFEQRARQHLPDFSLKANYQAVAEICRLVDGNPLALEMAAASLVATTCQAITREIRKSIDFLNLHMSDIPPRHRSMRAMFDEMLKLLTPPEQQAFILMAVFRGGFTAHAAHEIAHAGYPILHQLVERGFITHHAPTKRYTIHEALRQYAERLLAVDPELYRATFTAHSQYYADLLYRHKADFEGSRLIEAMQAVEPELDNLWRMWHWITTNHLSHLVVRSVRSMGMFCSAYGNQQELAREFIVCINNLKQKPTLSANDYHAIFKISLYLVVLNGTSYAQTWRSSIQYIDQARAHLRNLTDEDAIMYHAFRGLGLSNLNRHQSAIVDLEQAWAISQDHPTTAVYWLAGYYYTAALIQADDLVTADTVITLIFQTIDVHHTPFAKAAMLPIRGILRLEQGNFNAARTDLLDVLDLHRQSIMVITFTLTLYGIVRLLVIAKHDETALELLYIATHEPFMFMYFAKPALQIRRQLEDRIPPTRRREIEARADRHFEEFPTRSNPSGLKPGTIDYLTACLTGLNFEKVLLTPRQLEVLRLMAEGRTNKSIAERLMVQEGTVKTYTSQIYDRLEVKQRTRTAAVNLARRLGLI